MVRPTSEHPTEMELQILKVLWDQPPQLVRDVRQALALEGRDIAHTSVITALNIMVDKGYLKRTKDGKSYRYAANVSREDVSEGIVGDVLRRVFDGSPSAVMLSLFNCADVDEGELKELRRMINRQINNKHRG